MRRALSLLVLGLLFGAALAVAPPTTFGQACSFNTLPNGRACSKPGAKCSPPTVGSGNAGNCATEASRGNTIACECQGAPTPSYNVTLTPLTPSEITTGAATSTITVTPFNNFAGQVDFTCAVTGMTHPVPSCATPPSATVSGSSATSPLVVTSSESTADGTFTVTVSAKDIHGRPPDNGPQSSTVLVSHVLWTIGSSLRAGGIALLAFLLLLTLWGLSHMWRSKRAASQ